MSLIVATLFVGFVTVMAWPLGLRRHVVAAYVALILILLHFLVPLLLAWRGDAAAVAYASDSGFVSALVVAYLLIVAGFTYIGGTTRRPLLPQEIDGPRLTSRASLLISALWTLYLIARLAGEAATFSATTSRSAELISLRANAATDGSFDFLLIILGALAYFSLFSMFSRSGGWRRLSIWLFAGWFILQFASILLTSLHRSPVVFLVAAHLIVIHKYVRPLPMARGLVILAVASMPFLMSVLADVRADQLEVAQQRTLEERLFHGSSGVATSLEFYHLVELTRDGRIEPEHGKQLEFSAVSWVPRVVWDDKPLVSFSFRKTLEIHGPIASGNWVRTYTAWGEGYAQFGYAGIWLYSALIIGAISLVLRMWSKVPGLVYPYVHLLVSLPLLLRGDLFALISRALPLVAITGLIVLLTSLRSSQPTSRTSTRAIRTTAPLSGSHT